MVHLPFPKLTQLDDVNASSEPTIQLVRPGDWAIPHVKVASESLDYIKHVKPVPNETIILVLAMSAGEYWGSNRNGDAWPEHPLRIGDTEITAEQVLPKCYKTIETHANVFKHHVNKDPNKRLGKVLKAFYNYDMHRVELLLSLCNRAAEDVVQQVESGEFPAVSMGTKIPYDVCDICGHKAPNRSHYCDHVKYQLTKYLPNGKQVFVWNPSSTFFDISIVRRPADRIGFMMKKVANAVPEIWSSAELGERVDYYSRKLSAARKLSVMDKVIGGNVAATKEDGGDVNVVSDFAKNVAKPVAAQTPPLDDTVIEEMLRHSPAKVLATLASMGVFLTTPEFIKFFVWRLVPALKIPDGLLDKAVDTQSQVFQILAENPDLIEEIENGGFLGMGPENVSPELKSRFSSLLEKRSQHTPYVRKRLISNMLKNEPKGKWDLLYTRDPASGQRMKTTRGAVEAARGLGKEVRFEQSLRNVLGSGALLSAAYKLLGHTPTGVPAQMAYAPPLEAHTGERVPAMTEMSLKNAALHLAHDWSVRNRQETEPLKLANEEHMAFLLSDANFDNVSSWLGKVICS